MTTYKGINGFAVQSVGSDPSPLDEGQVWYNNASYAFKLASVTTAGAWATGGNMGTARYRMGSAGSQTASLAFGGAVPIPPPNAKPAVCVPAPEELFLEVDKAPPDDQAAALNPANLKA